MILRIIFVTWGITRHRRCRRLLCCQHDEGSRSETSHQRAKPRQRQAANKRQPMKFLENKIYFQRLLFARERAKTPRHRGWKEGLKFKLGKFSSRIQLVSSSLFWCDTTVVNEVIIGRLMSENLYWKFDYSIQFYPLKNFRRFHNCISFNFSSNFTTAFNFC